MQITAKFSSKCPKCNSQIAEGTQVEWNPGEKATHIVCPQVQVVETAPVAKLSTDEIGVFVLADNSVVQTKASKQNVGRVYAKRWTHIGGVRLTDAGEKVNAEYVYEAGLGQILATQLANGSAHKMTAEEAHTFSTVYGVCARCARNLKDATSVSLALGPVCRKYFGIELENSRQARRREVANVVVEVDDEARMRALEEAEDPGNRAERLLAEKEYAEDRAANERLASKWELDVEDYAF